MQFAHRCAVLQAFFQRFSMIEREKAQKHVSDVFRSKGQLCKKIQSGKQLALALTKLD